MSLMTIDAYILDIKDEFPHLESEIRSILISRAQSGATIQDIRDDYHVLTGNTFPIKDNITEFLLSIPYVTAMCNPNGTRIFNILPSEKTKHVYDMVIGQKPPPYRPPSYNYPRQSSFGNSTNSQPPWFNHSNNQWVNNHNQNQNHNPNHNYNHINWMNNNPSQWVYVNNHNFHSNRPSSVQTRSSEKNSSRCESEANCFFEDNYQYLFNRFQPREELQNNFNNVPKNQPQKFINKNLDTNHSNAKSMNINHLHANHLNTNNDDGVFQGHFPQPQSCTSSQAPVSPTTICVQDQEWGPMNDWAHGAHLFDFQLMGDDFFLYLARMELKCKFRPGERVLQSGLCVSGQSISAATKRVQSLNYVNRRMIINLGSVDILQGKALVQIQHDFLELLSVLRERGVTPIVTTLAPLALFAHEKTIKDKVERFNVFIKQRATKVIDIWSCVVNERGQTLFDCYQDKPRQITGGLESYLFWNKIGRQRVLKKIESEIEY